jgi:tripartite-type tricarboxylate transporter receptor subunit TctC
MKKPHKISSTGAANGPSHPSRRRGLLLGAVGLALQVGSRSAAAQGSAEAYPSKPITLVVPFGPGSGTDQQARSLGNAISAEYKVPVVVENRVGASGFIASQFVARAAPDGYTVLVTTNTTQAANEHLYKKLPYDPVKDFAPVTLLSKGYMVLVVGPASPAQSVADLLAMARKARGKLSFGSGSSSSRVAGELFAQLAGVEVLHVPYKSNPQALTDLLGGQIDFMFADTNTALPLIKADKLRPLAASAAQRLPLLPTLPTLAETVKGYDMSYWTAVYLPAATPEPVVKRLNEMFLRVSRLPDLVAFQARTGGEIATTSPVGLAAFQAAESQKWGKVIRTAGIEPE